MVLVEASGLCLNGDVEVVTFLKVSASRGIHKCFRCPLLIRASAGEISNAKSKTTGISPASDSSKVLFTSS